MPRTNHPVKRRSSRVCKPRKAAPRKRVASAKDATTILYADALLDACRVGDVVSARRLLGDLAAGIGGGKKRLDPGCREKLITISRICEALRNTWERSIPASFVAFEKERRRAEGEAFRALRADLLTRGVPPDLWIARFARYVHEYERRIREWDVRIEQLTASINADGTSDGATVVKLLAELEREINALLGEPKQPPLANAPSALSTSPSALALRNNI